MKRIWIYLRKYKLECILAPLFKMLEALFDLFVPTVIKLIIDDAIPSADKGLVVKSGLLLLGLAVVGLACSFTAQFFSAKAAVGCSTAMRHSLFEHIQSLSFTELDKLGSSTLITRMTSDINQIQNGVNLTLRLLLRSPFIVFGAMVMAVVIDTKAGLIFAVTIVILSIIVFGIMFVTRPMYKKAQGSLDGISTITRENLTGVRVIRAFNKQESEVKAFNDANNRLNKLQRKVGGISGLMNPLTYVVVSAATIGLMYYGVLRINEGSLTRGQVAQLYSYMAMILVELVKLANVIINITKALACANRVDAVFMTKYSMADGTLDVKGSMTNGTPDANGSMTNATLNVIGSMTNATLNVTGSMTDATPDVNGSFAPAAAQAVKSNAVPAVEFKNVSFTYSGSSDDSLTDVSFRAYPGQTIGIIGGTGSGKTSLANLIPRFYDATSGEVLIFGKNIKEYRLASLKSSVVTVLQKAQLFKGTVRDNMKWGNPDAGDDEIIEALKLSQSYEFIKEKEGFLDFEIEQNGRNLSGGQRQRLTIARALVGKPDVLILDDSASALDYATDAALRRALSGLSPKPTVFIISQRASTLAAADLILVMDDGMIAGAGKQDELMETCDIYREIYNSQNS